MSSQLDQIESLLITIVEWINNVNANKKRTDQHDHQVTIDGDSKIRVFIDGVSKYVTATQLLNSYWIIIDGLPFALYKHNLNIDPDKRGIQEINDVIVGFNNDSDFMNAIYLGGDVTDFRNEAVYNNFGGFYND